MDFFCTGKIHFNKIRILENSIIPVRKRVGFCGESETSIRRVHKMTELDKTVLDNAKRLASQSAVDDHIQVRFHHFEIIIFETRLTLTVFFDWYFIGWNDRGNWKWKYSNSCCEPNRYGTNGTYFSSIIQTLYCNWKGVIIL